MTRLAMSTIQMLCYCDLESVPLFLGSGQLTDIARLITQFAALEYSCNTHASLLPTEMLSRDYSSQA